MKTKQVSRILAMALSTAALAVYGCGGGGGGGTTAPATTTGTTISGATQATSASGSGTQSASVGSNTGQTLSNLAAVGTSPGAPHYRSPLAGKDNRFNKLHAAEIKALKVPQMKKAAALKKAKALASGKKAPIAFPGTTEPCTDGGTVAITGSVDSVTYAYTMTMTFANCRDMDTESSGTITNSGTFSANGADTFTMKLGDGDGTIETTDFRVREFTDNYTNLFAAYTADMTMTGSGDPTLNATTGDVTGYTFTYTGNGKEEYTDFIDTYTLTFTNLIFSSTSTFGATVSSGSDTINGIFSESWTVPATATTAATTETVAITFGDGDTSAEPTTNTDPDFTIAWVTDWALYYKYSVDGQVATDYTTPSDTDCFDGTFLIDTTTPINENLSTGLTTAGQMTINTNTTVTFNADGTVTVAVSGQTPASYSSKNEMEAVCKIEDTKDDTSGTTDVSTDKTQTTAGSTMTITALSSYPATSTSTLDCFTDVHVNFYNTTTPTAATTGTWYVDWHTGLIGVDASLHNDYTKTCTSPAGLTFEEALDITGDGICDVGLDINGSQLDSASNGTEHFTALALPSGYYVVSINNWSCPVDVKSDVSIKIGSDLFTGFSGTYTASDGEGTTPGAWYRVTDIKVNADGTVNLLTPDSTLQPWHDGTFGVLAPASKSPRKK